MKKVLTSYILLLPVSVLVFSFNISSALAATYHCKVAQHSGRDVIAKGHLSFEDSIINNQRTLTNIKAEITTVWDERGWSLSEGDNYNGSFKIESLVENNKYRARKYKNHSQFKSFKATESEYGMWGNLIVEKHGGDKSKIEAHYIFQAGDHMGGTIDFTCHLGLNN